MEDVLSRPASTADHRIHYGQDPSQFGDLWLPPTGGKSVVPLVVFFHGGWWKSEYDLSYASHLCADLKQHGIAAWSVEYRRVGKTGGGYPRTFQDAASGFDFAATLAGSYPLDLSRVITMGHSAGGHLAFWIAGRHHIEPGSELYQPRPQVPLLAAIALAGAVDLRLTIDLSGYLDFAHDKQEVFALMGGPPAEYRDRYKAGNPGDLLPFNVPQFLIQGTEDDQIPAGIPERWAQNAQGAGDKVAVTILPGADHFDVVDPQSHAWPAVREIVQRAVQSKA